MNKQWHVYFLISLLCLFIGLVFYCGALALEKLNTKIDGLQIIVNSNISQVEDYKAEVKTLEDKVDKCETREQTIINNVLNNW